VHIQTPLSEALPRRREAIRFLVPALATGAGLGVGVALIGAFAGFIPAVIAALICALVGAGLALVCRLRARATQAAIAIENERLHSANRGHADRGGTVRRSEELAALLRATRSVMDSLDLATSLDRILAEAGRIARVPAVQLLLVDRDRRILRVSAQIGPALPSDFEVPIGCGYSGTVAATGEPVYVAEPAEQVLRLQGSCRTGRRGAAPTTGRPSCAYGHGICGQAFAARSPVYAFEVEPDARRPAPDGSADGEGRVRAAVPLISGEDPVGVLTIAFGPRGEFTAEETELMRLLADHAAVAIAKRRSAEDLETAHRQLEQVLASISSIMIAVNASDGITQWNEAAETTFGIPSAAVIGWSILDAPITWEWPDMVERITEARGKDTPTRVDDIRYRRPDGRDGFLGLTLTPMRSGAGLLILGSDITNRRIVEAQLVQAQKLESLGQLAAGVAHELNTPIQFVGDNVRFLETAFADAQRLIARYRELHAAATAGAALAGALAAVDEVEREVDVDFLVREIPGAIGQSLEGVTRVANIVRALKGFAHPDAKERVATDLNQALLSTLAVARNEIEDVADVETDLADLPPVTCQPGEMNQVFLNLVVNAAHAIADTVNGTSERGVIRVRTRREEDLAVIEIADTGSGIPSHVAPRIFDPFFTTKAVGRGTGQGLAIARDVVVNRHSGSLTFESEVGRGTTFVVRIPIHGPTSRGDPPHITEPVGHGPAEPADPPGLAPTS
jgi:PAS domain S-box-containing protein